MQTERSGKKGRTEKGKVEGEDRGRRPRKQKREGGKRRKEEGRGAEREHQRT